MKNRSGFQFFYPQLPSYWIERTKTSGNDYLGKIRYLSIRFYLPGFRKNSDLNKIEDPELLSTEYQDRTITLDEIQRFPNIFPLIRAMVDENRRQGKFIVLGSASPKLLRQSSESLAGRINYLEMAPLNILEINPEGQNKLWLTGRDYHFLIHSTKTTKDSLQIGTSLLFQAMYSGICQIMDFRHIPA